MRLQAMALLVGLSGCTGTIAGNGSTGATGTSSPANPSGGAAGLPGGVAPGAAGGPAVSSAVCAATPLDPGPVFLRRLTNGEYRQTVRDLLGAVPDPTGTFP